MWLTSLKIKNLRVFKSAELILAAGPSHGDLSNVTVFLGTNGSGKTSLLRAIALAALGAVLPSSGMRPYSLVRRVESGVRTCVIEGTFLPSRQDGFQKQIVSSIKLQNMRGFNDKFGAIKYPRAVEEQLWDDNSPACLVVGYGATRLVDSFGNGYSEATSRKSRSVRYQRVAGLFEEQVTLRSLSSWLPEYQNPGRRKQIATLINKLLVDVGISISLIPVDNEYLFKVGDATLPFAALSDGYRAYIGWISDLLFHICMGCPSGMRLDESQGIVLVDEIDLHLHPQWQRTVVTTLARTLPKMQFFFTTHSPLIAGTVPRDNIFVVSTQNNKARLDPSTVDVYGWSVDQILNSKLFDETPARNPEAVKKIMQASVKARSGNTAAAMELMQVLADGLTADSRTPDHGRVRVTSDELIKLGVLKRSSQSKNK
ncbi:AAA family ATPase [Burkholderia gladioli]|uniref:AAA family ATPase n=1 Tax=Burkholderia gladioli TaxID=28095 RepID=UPI002FE000D9